MSVSIIQTSKKCIECGTVFNLQEIWKDIKGYEGIYKISNMGNVKSLERNTYIPNAIRKEPEKLLKPQIRNGYYIINLCKNHIRKQYSIHRLVAEAFIPNIHNKPFINHKDYNKLNNNVDNLEWVTQKENVEWSKCNMHNRRNVTHSNTKEKYITYRKSSNKYRVTIDKKEYKSCNTLEEAIKLRNKILNEVVKK